jgi:HEAT repeat protein
MSLLTDFQATRAIATILSEDASVTSEGKRALLRLKQIGEPAIPKLIEALGRTKNTATLEQLLLGLVRNNTLSTFVKALGDSDQRVVDGVTRILKRSTDFNPNDLFPFFEDPEISKTSLGDVLLTHADRINSNSLLALLDKADSKLRPILYKLLDMVAQESLVPDLVQKLDSDQPMVRAHLLNVLARFDTEESLDGLAKGLSDPNKAARLAALDSLAKLKEKSKVADICKLLRDPDLTVQSAAIETLGKIRSPETVKHLITVLQDESEYVRRAAVEVLNEVGDQSAVKDLLIALRDADWWVKVRAADALGTIGGPMVFDAVLALIKDPDEFLRRTAVEILNTSKDPRSIDRLIEALRDQDWWVRERAIDALAAIGDSRAVPHLITILNENPEAGQVVIRALSTLGDKRAIHPLLKQLETSNNALRKEALKALEGLTDDANAAAVQDAATQLINVRNDDVGNVANETVRTLITRFGDRTASANSSPLLSAVDLQMPIDDMPTEAMETNKSRKSLEDTHEVSATMETGFINPAQLVPNTLLAGRYNVIRKIGEGAFGVVWLVDDIVVNDQLILKFLNPHVAADQNMIERFTHELRYARKITHENIIRIYDLVAIGQSYAISMEYFPSHSLADELRKNKGKSFNILRSINLISSICQGMAPAQMVGVVHRDLKPANILINDDDLVKIVDFGLAAAARRIDSRLTKSGILVGTPTYMAPEQVRAQTIDSRTDIYTLGIIMYEMLTGRAPYQGDESMAILYQHIEGNVTPPREHNPDIPESLQAIILKAMAVEPKQRFQTFDELRERLEDVAKQLKAEQSY